VISAVGRGGGGYGRRAGSLDAWGHLRGERVFLCVWSVDFCICVFVVGGDGAFSFVEPSAMARQPVNAWEGGILVMEADAPTGAGRAWAIIIITDQPVRDSASADQSPEMIRQSAHIGEQGGATWVGFGLLARGCAVASTRAG
jgi:hypothetical protein